MSWLEDIFRIFSFFSASLSLRRRRRRRRRRHRHRRRRRHRCHRRPHRRRSLPAHFEASAELDAGAEPVGATPFRILNGAPLNLT